MENLQDNEPEFVEQEAEQEGAVEIYSRNAILGFSIFFSTIFGGALLVINLFKAGLRKAGWIVIAFSIIYYLLGIFVVKGLSLKGSVPLLLPIVFNIGGGFILSNYFFPKYFPDDDYYPRSIWGALMVSLIISLAVLSLSGYLLPPAVKPVK